MCGIVGTVHSEPGGVDQELVRKMCALIRRRGPDGDGFFFDGQVGLGMRRLAIIDVNSGHQPVYNEDRTVAVVFNGEIYNGGFKFQVQRVHEGAIAQRLPGAWRR